MPDFMDTALNYQPGIRIEPDAKRWVITNGITQMPLCEMCTQPIQEGHVGCSCDKSHNPANCDRLTYDQLGEHLRRVTDDNMDFAMRYRNLLQTLLDRSYNGGNDIRQLTILSLRDIAEIETALAWLGD